MGNALAAFIGVILVVVGCSAVINSCSGSSGRGDVAACVSRGINYFQEIGSYPTLSDGRDAHEVAQERCNRTTTAF